MMLLNTLYSKIRNIFCSKEETKDPELRASILIGIDKKQQYYFDIKWDYENTHQTASDLSNLVLGLTYGLFTNQIKNLLINHNIKDKPYDELILQETVGLIQERSDVLEKILDADEKNPIVRPSEVFRQIPDAQNN